MHHHHHHHVYRQAASSPHYHQNPTSDARCRPRRVSGILKLWPRPTNNHLCVVPDERVTRRVLDERVTVRVVRRFLETGCSRWR
jgi:hypothetical protein